MDNNSINSDYLHKEVALLEYVPSEIGKKQTIEKGKYYVGHTAHIYDSVNGNEEQVFVLTNNGQGTQQKAVPYSASDEDRAQIQDVTVLMKGSETGMDPGKLRHDTITDWLGTDLPTAIQILTPGGASNHVTEYAKKLAREKGKD